MSRISLLLLGLSVLSSPVTADSLQYEGIIKPVTEFQLIAQQPGAIEYDVEEGSIVEANGVIAHVERKKQELEMRIAEASVREAAASLEQVQQEHVNEEALFKKGTVSKKALQNSNLKILSAIARLDRETASYELKKNSFEQTLFRTPVKAIFLEKNIKDYNYVNTGEEIAHMVNIDVAEVEIYPSFGEFSSFKLNDRVEVSLSSQQSVEGKVVFVSPEVDTTTNTFKVKVQLDNLKDQHAKNVLNRYQFVPGALVQVAVEENVLEESEEPVADQ